jgi:hypothetical protein
MARVSVARIVSIVSVVAASGWLAAPALGWTPASTTLSSILYNQGITDDPVFGSYFYDGVTSTVNSGLYRTSPGQVLRAANFAVIPSTVEGYNHAGDLSFDWGARVFGPPTPSRRWTPARRVLLPLECYYPSNGGNTCGSGAIGVAAPQTLRFRYYVNLDRSQIQKAMWAEISPDGRWLWTSSGTHLLVYRASSVNALVAARQRAGKAGGIVGEDLGAVLPSSAVTGAAFWTDPTSHRQRLLLALNLGASFEVISYGIGVSPNGSPTILPPSPLRRSRCRDPISTTSPRA